MRIECMTTMAAAEVLSLLINAYLRPGREFHITDPHPPGPPVHFILIETSCLPGRTSTGHPRYHHCRGGRHLAHPACQGII